MGECLSCRRALYIPLTTDGHRMPHLRFQRVRARFHKNPNHNNMQTSKRKAASANYPRIRLCTSTISCKIAFKLRVIPHFG
jgi:hypothetical protein